MIARRGFTLIEVVVVLTILGILAAVTIPTFRDFGRTDPLPEGASQILGLLRSARQAAIERTQDVQVILDPAKQAYWVETVNDSAPAMLAQGRFALPPSVSIVGSNPRLRMRFSRSGSADGDSIALTSSDGSAVVGINRWTGEPYARIAGQ